MANKVARVIANTGSKAFRTVNIATSGTGPVHTQTASPVKGVHPTYQDSGGSVKGLKTIVIPGYVAPA